MLLLSSSTFMAFPWLAGKLIDAANHKPVMLPNGIELGIDRIATAAVWRSLCCQGLFSFGRIWFFTQVSEFTVRDIRQALYAKFVQLPIPFFEQNRVGAITSRITSDVAQIQDTFSLTLAELFRQVFTLVVGITAIMVVSVKLSLFMLLTFPPIVLAAGLFGRKIRTLARTTQQELATTNTIVEETLQAINSVKAFTNEQFETRRYTASLDRVVAAALRSNLYRGGFVSFVIIGLTGGIILILWRGRHAGVHARPRPPRSQPAAHVPALHGLHRRIHCGPGRDVRQGAEYAGRLGAHSGDSGRNARAHPPSSRPRA